MYHRLETHLNASQAPFISLLFVFLGVAPVVACGAIKNCPKKGSPFHGCCTGHACHSNYIKDKKKGEGGYVVMLW